MYNMLPYSYYYQNTIDHNVIDHNVIPAFTKLNELNSLNLISII